MDSPGSTGIDGRVAESPDDARPSAAANWAASDATLESCWIECEEHQGVLRASH
jgi:hypothetical protein